MRAAVIAIWKCAVCLALGLAGTNAFAWGKDGHAIVATLAQAQLSPKAKAEIEKLLALEPGATLASIASWADEQRDRSTAAWHYINFPKGSCNYDPARDCPDGNCVVAALTKRLEILKSAATPQEQLTALKYVVHFAGDIHQPLHAGYVDDKGGNSYQVRFGDKGTNLHSLWDSGMLRAAGVEFVAATVQAIPAKTYALEPTKMAEESCKLVQAEGFYPDRVVSEAYAAKYVPIMQDRLAAAGARLAWMLNLAFK